MGYIGRPNDSIHDLVKRIADALCGEEETEYEGSADILHHSLERIAEYFEGGVSVNNSV